MMRINELLELDFTAESDLLFWALDKIKSRLPIMLIQYGAEDIACNIDQRDIDAALPKLVAWAEPEAHRKG